MMKPRCMAVCVMLFVATRTKAAWTTHNRLWSTSEVTTVPDGDDTRLEYRQSPCSDHGFFLQKNGRLTVASNTPGETGFEFEYPDDVVYTWADHGSLGMELHPDFPTQPYLFMLFSLENNPPWGDECKNVVNRMSLCKSLARLVRFTLDVTVSQGKCTKIGFTQTAANPYTLMEGLCSTSNTHGIGDIRFYPTGDLLMSSGDLSQANGPDHGLTEDACFEPANKYPQGRFRSQRLDYYNGKVLLIFKESLLMTTGRLAYQKDFMYMAIGLRQPYSMTVDWSNGHAYVGDVGSNIREEINHLTPADFAKARLNPAPVNFGWPCIEGTAFLSDTGAGLDKIWIQSNQCNPNTMLCDLCKDIYPCATNAPGSGGCSANYRPPAFEYRHVILDPEFPDECNGASSSIAGLAVFRGKSPQFGATGASFMPNNLVAADYATGCMWMFNNKADGTPNFVAGAHLLMSNYFTVSLNSLKDGYLYSVAPASPFTIYRHGVITLDDPPVAVLLAYVKSAQGGTYVQCVGTCQVALGTTIRFDASSSAAGGASISSYTFNFGDGSGLLIGTNKVAERTYSKEGIMYASVVVTDAAGKTSTAKWNVLVGKAVSITMTPSTGNWKFGDTISYALDLSSPALVGSKVAATATISHCYPNECTGLDDCHTHPWNVDAGYATSTVGKLTPPEHDMPSNVVLQFTITPPGSASSFDVHFDTHCLEYFATLRSAVAGSVRWWPITSGELDPCLSPCTQQPYMAKNTAVLSANAIQTDASGNIFKIQGWTAATAGGTTLSTATGTSATPEISQDKMVITANYAAVTTSTSADAPPALVGLTGRYKAIELAWELPPGRSWDWIIASVSGGGKDYSATYPAAGSTTVTVPVPPVGSAWSVKLAGYFSASNARTAWGPTATVSSSSDVATQLCEYTPYGAYPAGSNRKSIPGTIENEHYAVGGNGIGYYDTTKGNVANRGTDLRKDDVDIKLALNTGQGGFGSVVTSNSEWLNYPVTVAASGGYNILFTVNVPSGNTAKTILLMVDRPDCSASTAAATIVVPLATPQDTPTTVSTRGVWLDAGAHTLRLCMTMGNGNLNLDRMVFTSANGATPPPAPKPTPAAPTPPTRNPTNARTVQPTAPPQPTAAPVSPKTAAPTNFQPTPKGATPTALPTKTPTRAPAPVAGPTPKPSDKTPTPAGTCAVCPLSASDKENGLGATLTDNCTSTNNIGCNTGGVWMCRTCVWDATKISSFPYSACPDCVKPTYCAANLIPATKC